MKLSVILFFSCICAFLFQPGEPKHHIEEASGVCVSKDYIYIGFESSTGNYLKLKKKDINTNCVLHLNNCDELEQDSFEICKFPLDVESIESDDQGRIFLLSELTRSVYSSNGVELVLPDEFSEVGGKGAEGIALKPFKNVKNAYESVVVWEGGFMDTRKLMVDFKVPLFNCYDSVYQVTYNPRFRIDTFPILNMNKSVKTKKTKKLNLDSLYSWTTTHYSYPKDTTIHIGYRATDVVWYKNELVVLLSAARRSTKEDTIYFDLKVLQKFDREGNPTSSPYDLKVHRRTMCQKLNWEGMDWYEENESLVFVNDAPSDKPTQLVFLNYPDTLK